ncbi:MAG: DNA ligase-1 [Oceanicoccus sp.]|jgi:DNA ligase-1
MHYRQFMLTTYSLLLLLTSNLSIGATPPALTLATNYHSNIDLNDYWVSEKLDGVRAYWNGQQLISRGGNPIHAPQWFIKQLPNRALDGELWSGRGRFQQTVSIVRKQQPIDTEWLLIRYMVFDLPNSLQPFDQRLRQLQQLLPTSRQEPIDKSIQLIAQYKIASEKALQAKLNDIVRLGGEGLVLHRGAALYRAGRQLDLLKLKPYYDTEARVIDYKAGKGKYQGLVGSMLMETPQGQRFYLGSGLTDKLRAQPPAIGSMISYRYSGFTDAGLPRHPRFLRIRLDHNF